MIADEMGLGKTVQAIAVACAFRQEWPLLVVVPSSLKYPWIEELERWIPELQPGDINLVENKSHITGINSSKVTVLGYGLLASDSSSLVEALTRQHFGVIIVDESHYLKSRNAVRTKILVPLLQSTKRAILLTGTPALGRPEELFMQIDALFPKMFGTWTDYAKKYCNAHYRYFGPRRQWDCRGASNLEELHQKLSQIMIRRLKVQVLTQLPPKIRQRIPFDLPKDASKEATASFAEWERLMKSLGSGIAATENPFTEVMGLVTQMYKQTAVAKAGAVKDYIKMMLETEQLKFLVFAHHLTMLQACTEAVIEAKAGYIRIDGSVPSSERIELVRKFQNDTDTRVAILSILAAGTGLTFTAASHVVFAELYWNPGQIKQAEDRAHRIGQVSSVNVHYLIAKGTFDTVMWSMLNRKENVTGSTLNGRKEYLKAEEGDKDTWEFLNFAKSWSPSEMVLPLPGHTGQEEKAMYFTHFEKDKQHDIRSFLSPSGKKKKRKRTEDQEWSPAVASESGKSHDTHENESEMSQSPDEDFSPQLKKLRAQQKTLSPGSCVRKKRLSVVSSPHTGLDAVGPQKCSDLKPCTDTWNCEACTYTNSGLLPYCEMCELQRSSSGPSKPQLAQTHILLHDSDSEQELSQGKAWPLDPCKDKHSDEEEGESQKGKQNTTGAEEEGETEKQWLKGKQSEGDGGEVVVAGSSGSDPLLPPHHTQDQTHPSAHTNDTNQDNDGDPTYPVYAGLQFRASQYTDRVYLYTKDAQPLNLSFIPLDVKLTNWDDLPEAFTCCRENQIQVLRFVQEWCSLTAMKKKLLRRSGLLFHSPTLGLQQLDSAKHPHSSTKRYLSKEDVAQASLTKAQQEGGSIQLVTKEKQRSFTSALTPPAVHREEVMSEEQKGFLQAVSSDGVPLCLSCQQRCLSSGGSWDTRFCSHKCQEEFQLKSSQTYMRMQVLKVEQGICQACGLHAHELFLKVRDAPPSQRKEMLENTCLAQLSLKQLNEMIRAPVEGAFWQVDHIRPVYSGGGQCSLDNLQTLCTVCHKSRTAQQAKDRSRRRRSEAAIAATSDISRFFIRK
ncbi:DNA annealing helicase and endonuclease ZRANB3 isoform X3 [Cynoglossus semilaevis]|nr:DNA annealing helicase and endonuclease ZRANB3 isoform X3 [Cynoglossus semilaevis]